MTSHIDTTRMEHARRPRICEADRCRTMREAAEMVFLREGYSATSMDKVARNAGMSKRTLYQHYPSKAALFEAVIETALAPLHMDTTLEDEPDLASALIGMLDAAARHLLAPRQAAIFRLVIAETNRSPELAEAFHRSGPGRGANSLQRRIVIEKERGRLRVDDPREAASMLYGMAIGALQMRMLLGLRGPPTDSEIAQRVHIAVETFLNGALVEAAPGR
jgi:TetR/AcrR family transcriptional regulator of autoinduction and epiphytic fitness